MENNLRRDGLILNVVLEKELRIRKEIMIMSRDRIKNSTYNMMSGFLYQLITIIMSFLSRTVFIRTLGIDYLGLSSIFADVLNLLSMADLGFSTAMAYSFYKPLAEHDEKQLIALICFYKKVYRIIASAVTVLGLAMIPFLKWIINTEKEIPHLILYYLFSLAGVVITYLFVYRSQILTADQKSYEVLKISIWTTLLRTIFQILILLIWHNYIIYLSIGFLFQLLNNLIVTKKADNMYPFIKNKERINKEEEKKIFLNMKSIFLYKIGTTIFGATDNVVISLTIGTAMVGIYSNYLLVSNKLLLMIQIVFAALTSSIGNVIVVEESERRYEIFKAVQSMSLVFCGIITSVFYIMANDLVFIWLGSEYTISTTAIIALTLNTYLSCSLLPLLIYRDATGLYMKTKYVMLLGAVLNIVLAIIMGNLWGLTGILFASAVSRVGTYFWYEPKILFKECFKKKVKGYYLSILYNALLVVVTIGIISRLFCTIEVDGWLMLIVKGCGIGVVCTVAFGGAYARTDGFQMIIKVADSFIKRVIRKKGGSLRGSE